MKDIARTGLFQMTSWLTLSTAFHKYSMAALLRHRLCSPDTVISTI